MEGDTHIFWRTGRLALLAGAALTLGACAGLEAVEPGTGAAINPESAAVPAVAAAIGDPGPWPTFASIPRLPADLRSPDGWRDAVAEQEADRLFIEREAAADSWSLSDTEAFAAGLRSTAAEVDVRAPTDAEMAESEAYARTLRARATPPPLPR